jgi:hypothetical protein
MCPLNKYKSYLSVKQVFEVLYVAFIIEIKGCLKGVMVFVVFFNTLCRCRFGIKKHP